MEHFALAYQPEDDREEINVVGVWLCAGGRIAAVRVRPGVADSHDGLYKRIGAQEGIATVVDGFLGKVGADDRVNGRFANTDMPKLKALLIDQVCEATGGPCKYAGKSMLDAHTGMNVTDNEFGIIAAHFAAAMVDAGVQTDDNTTIMGVLAGMHDDIVGQ